MIAKCYKSQQNILMLQNKQNTISTRQGYIVSIVLRESTGLEDITSHNLPNWT
jgi:hypothetical protein